MYNTACSRNVDLKVCDDDVADLALWFFTLFITCRCYSICTFLMYENVSKIQGLSEDIDEHLNIIMLINNVQNHFNNLITNIPTNTENNFSTKQ